MADAGSIALAEAAMQMDGSFLEIGTGSGFIAIALALQGKEVVACDVSNAALACAEKNCAILGAEVSLLSSDLFKDIAGRYDVIIFNPPSNADESDADRQRKNQFKELMPPYLWKPLSRIFQATRAPGRRKYLQTFIRESGSHLNPGGSLLLNLIAEDLHFIERLADVRTSQVRSSPGGVVVRITATRPGL
ncbi:MAG: methyltransferase [Nocardioidaceae bacterium]